MESTANDLEAVDRAKNAVLGVSQEMPSGSIPVRGYDFSEGLDYHKLLQSYKNVGLQATSFGLAVEEINKMLEKRNESFIPNDSDAYEEDEFIKRKSNCTIFLGYTSNMISSGVRESILFLVKNKLIDCIVSTAGGIEEDFIKCFQDSYIGDFALKGKELRSKGMNRIGNMIVPNNNYCKFEDWINPILDKMLEEQKNDGIVWSPSKMITRLGLEINNEKSVYYWAAKNKIPVFSPAITDGSIGDIIFFQACKNPGLVIDIVQDIKRINMMSLKALNSGMLIIGGGLIKHHIANANLMRNGADFSVYVNTSCEFEGSDSGANPDEAVSWGKIKVTATPVKVYAEASLVFPLLIAETFYKYYEKMN